MLFKFIYFIFLKLSCQEPVPVAFYTQFGHLAGFHLVIWLLPPSAFGSFILTKRFSFSLSLKSFILHPSFPHSIDFVDTRKTPSSDSAFPQGLLLRVITDRFACIHPSSIFPLTDKAVLSYQKYGQYYVSSKVPSHIKPKYILPVHHYTPCNSYSLSVRYGT